MEMATGNGFEIIVIGAGHAGTSCQPEAVREAGVWAEKYCRGRDCTIASFLLCRRAISFFVVNQFPSFPIVIDN